MQVSVLLVTPAAKHAWAVQTKTAPRVCVERCGDGLNFGMLECDDGNKIDGDGCSSECMVEKDWQCGGGSTTSKD
jgi:cysteine-rich repeat protein